MKLTRLDPNSDAPPLWRFMRHHLPPTMKADLSEGYGTFYYISDGHHRIIATPSAGFAALFAKLFKGFHDTLDVQRSEYLSDIQDVVNKYERETGRRVWVRYYEATK